MGEIYGSDIFELAKDKLSALMATLITDMASDDPKILAQYDYPNVVNPTLPCVSIHIDTADTLDAKDWTVSASGSGVLYEMEFRVRIHTDHANGAHDHDKIARLMNSVNNKLHENKDLGDSFRIKYTGKFSFIETFDESDTLGGEFFVTVHGFTTH